jgi:hypothetical protein
VRVEDLDPHEETRASRTGEEPGQESGPQVADVKRPSASWEPARAKDAATV